MESLSAVIFVLKCDIKCARVNDGLMFCAGEAAIIVSAVTMTASPSGATDGQKTHEQMLFFCKKK